MDRLANQEKGYLDQSSLFLFFQTHFNGQFLHPGKMQKLPQSEFSAMSPAFADVDHKASDLTVFYSITYCLKFLTTDLTSPQPMISLPSSLNFLASNSVLLIILELFLLTTLLTPNERCFTT